MCESMDELLSRAVGGDRAAMSALLERCGSAVRRDLSRAIDHKWRSVLDIDDVMQVTYLEAFLRIGQFTPHAKGTFDAWLRRIADNNLKDAIKELGRQKRPQPDARIPPQQDDDPSLSRFELLDGTPGRHAIRKECCEILATALSQLPPDYQRVVRLYDLEGLPVGEVAAALGRSEGAVYMMRSRAHERLRVLLGSAPLFLDDSV
jgi:RNA polymerase sigma-70 factor (ECF subfamily)